MGFGETGDKPLRVLHLTAHENAIPGDEDIIKLFLNSCEGPRRLKAASMLDSYLENAKKVVPQNIHFVIDI